MRRLFIVTLAALAGALLFVPVGVVAPAAHASETGEFSLTPDSCAPHGVGAVVKGFVAARDNTGRSYEDLRFDFRDGAGALTDPLFHGGKLGGNATFILRHGGTRVAAANPITLTVTSVAGNGYPELLVASDEMYCANLPGSIQATPALQFHPYAAVAQSSLARFVEELSGSPLTFLTKTSPATGVLEVAPNGDYTYVWGERAEVSFDVTVRNGAGVEAVLPVTLVRSRSPHISITPSATQLTFGDPLSISARVGIENVVPTPTGSVTFTSHGLSQSWHEPVDGGGWATLVLADLPVGDHVFSVVYHGDGEHLPAMSERVGVTVVAKAGPGTGETDCGEGETLNAEGVCVTTGTDGEGGEGENPDGEGGDGDGGAPDGGVKPKPLPNIDTAPVAAAGEATAQTVAARVANTGAGSSAWLAGASVLVAAAGVVLVARRRRHSVE